MSCGISEKAKVLTDKLDELDAKIDEALNDIPGVAEAQAFVDDLEGNINKIKDDVMAQIPILGGGSLPPELQSLQADVEKLGEDSFTREVLYFCASRGIASYLEAREQFEREVLLTDDYYNGIINVRIGGSKILKENIKPR